MQTLVLFLGFVVWSLGCVAAGMMFSAKKDTDIFISLAAPEAFDKEKLKDAYISDAKTKMKQKLGL